MLLLALAAALLVALLREPAGEALAPAGPRAEAGDEPTAELAAAEASSRSALEQPSAANDLESVAQAAPDGPDRTRVERAQEELEAQVDASLDGVLHVNALLDQILAFAELPVDEHVDFEYDANDELAYRLLGTPDGTTARFFVELERHELHGREFRALRIEIQVDDGKVGFHRGAMREGARVSLGMSYNEDGDLGNLAFLTERMVAIRDSRDAGIDAYSGTFTSGARYRVDLNDLAAPVSQTFGMIDGNYAPPDEFGGVSPLMGDLRLDPTKAAALRAALERHLRAVSGRRG